MVTLDSLVPKDHLLRLIDQHLSFDFIRAECESLYCPNNGRPALDPVMLFKMLFVGYLFGVRSERRLIKDIEVNVARMKKLTNMRAASADKTVVLKPPREMTLELALEYIADDELVEVTPGSIRLRKRLLDPNARKRHARDAAGTRCGPRRARRSAIWRGARSGFT